MMIKKNKGFSMVEVLLLVIVIGIIVAVSYFAYTNFVANKDGGDEQTKEVSSNSVIVENSSDLDDALNELDELSIEDAEGSELDTAATSF